MTGIFPRPEDDPKTVEPMTMKELNDIQAAIHCSGSGGANEGCQDGGRKSEEMSG